MSRVAVALGVCLVGAACGGTARAASGSWVGSYALPASAEPVAISVRFDGRRANVALGPGHASATTVAVSGAGARVRFAFPGLPSNVVFDGRK